MFQTEYVAQAIKVKHTFHFPLTPLFILPDIQSANVSEMCLKTTVRQDLVLSFKVTNNLINRHNLRSNPPSNEIEDAEI